MKKIKWLLAAALLGLSMGCATTAGTMATQEATAVPDSDGTFKQRIEFKDLPVEMQEHILYGG